MTSEATEDRRGIDGDAATPRRKRRDATARPTSPDARELRAGHRPISRSRSPTADWRRLCRPSAREPDWLRAERLAAARAFEALPVEPNQLYTLYLDLRAAELARRPAVHPDSERARPGSPVRASAGCRRSDRAPRGQRRWSCACPRGRRPWRHPRDVRRRRRPRSGRLPRRARRRRRSPRRREAGRARTRLLEPGRPAPRSGGRPSRRAHRHPLVRRRARVGR